MATGTIYGELVGIRPLRPFDAGVLRRFILDPELANLLFEEHPCLVPSSFAMSLDIAARWMSRQPEFAIVDRTGRLIGSIRLWRVSERNRSAMLTIFIGQKECWGRGYGTEALRLILREAFGRMNLQRVELHVFDFNQRAIRSYQKVGFVQEGIRRHALLRGRTYFDVIVMGILRDEFLAREAAEKQAAVRE